MRKNIDFDIIESSWHKTPGIIIAASAFIFVIAVSLFGEYEDHVRAEERRLVEERHKSISEHLKQKYKASDEWYEVLGGRVTGEIQRAKVLTRDIEALWLNKTIIYKGQIKDVSIHDSDSYLVELEEPFLLMRDTQLNLSLIADRREIDALLKSNDLTEMYIPQNIFVVAKINDLSSTTATDLGQEFPVRTGKGQLIAAMVE